MNFNKLIMPMLAFINFAHSSTLQSKSLTISELSSEDCFEEDILGFVSEDLANFLGKEGLLGGKYFTNRKKGCDFCDIYLAQDGLFSALKSVKRVGMPEGINSIYLIHRDPTRENLISTISNSRSAIISILEEIKESAPKEMGTTPFDAHFKYNGKVFSFLPNENKLFSTWKDKMQKTYRTLDRNFRVIIKDESPIILNITDDIDTSDLEMIARKFIGEAGLFSGKYFRRCDESCDFSDLYIPHGNVLLTDLVTKLTKLRYTIHSLLNAVDNDFIATQEKIALTNIHFEHNGLYFKFLSKDKNKFLDIQFLSRAHYDVFEKYFHAVVSGFPPKYQALCYK